MIMERISIENRLDFNEYMYCEGCINPYYRGRLHGLIASIIPIGWYLLLLHCETDFTKLIYSIYMSCNLLSYFSSYFFHRESYKYGPDMENRAIKMDRLCIFLHIAGNFTPVSVFFLKKQVYILLQYYGEVLFFSIVKYSIIINPLGGNHSLLVL